MFQIKVEELLVRVDSFEKLNNLFYKMALPVFWPKAYFLPMMTQIWNLNFLRRMQFIDLLNTNADQFCKHYFLGSRNGYNGEI